MAPWQAFRMQIPTAFHLLLLPAALGVVWFLRRERSWAGLLSSLAAFGVYGILLAGAFAWGSSLFRYMSLVSPLLFVYLPGILLFVCLFPLGRGPRRLLGSGALVLIGVGIWAFHIEPAWLEVERFTLASPKLTRPLRVVVVADLQTDVFGEYERQALSRVLAERGDLILFTGDYLQENDPARYAQLRSELRSYLHEIRLQAPLGVFAVRGDVEHDDWEDIFAGLPVRTFEQTTRVELDELTLTGLRSRDSRNHLAVIPPSEKFHLLFGHAPDFALDDPPADLLVAGHTHGGQVRLPFVGALLTLSDVPRSWAAGLTELSPGRHLVVSRGIGLERGAAPRIRFLCRPQIVTIDLVPALAAPAGSGTG